MRNRFYVWFGNRPNPAEIVPSEFLPQLQPGDSKYHVRILQNLEQLLPGQGLTFFLTWRVDDFHEAMQDAVVILVGEERNQTPSYRGKIRALFKTMGHRPNPLAKTLRLPFPIAWRTLLRDGRNTYINFRRSLKHGQGGKIAAPFYDIPPGYYSILEMEPPPIEERPVDVFFSGSCASRGWSLSAPYVARKQLAAAVEAARAALPHRRFNWQPQRGGFAQGLTPVEYTRALANAKIALAPRGNVDETYRLIEAAKMGCVVVGEPVAPRWYYRECPAVFLRKWSELPEILGSLLDSPAELTELSLRTRQWYDSNISESAVAQYIAGCLAKTDFSARVRK
jgi:hypothetical protein